MCLIYLQKENLQQVSQPESDFNKSSKETPTKVKKINRDSLKKNDEVKAEKETIILNVSHENSKEFVKETKEQPKDSVFKESKDIIKENVVHVQSASKESKKTKKKNDILAQIGKILITF